MSDCVDMTPEARWRHLRDNGPKSLTNIESHELISNKPEWFDEARFVEAKEAIQKFFIGVSYSSFTGLLLILQLPDGLEPLLTTGNSKDIPSLYKRYLNTILHVNSWYDDDIFNPETKGYKSIRQVRSMHKRVQALMNDKFTIKGVNGETKLWMTHYDVALTQFAFIGLAMLYPTKSAMIAASKEELELINYYWRVLGYLMGVADEFNACSFDKYEDIYEFNRIVFQHEYLDKYNTLACKTGLEMTQGICIALHYFMPLVTFNCLAHWWSDCFKFNGYEPQPMSAKEKVLDYWTRVSFNHLLKYEGFIRFSNKLHRKRFDQRLKNKDKVYEKLRDQYKDSTQYTYYSDRVDYFNKSIDKPIIDDSSAAATFETVECNNNTAEPVYNKQAPEGGCPFGFGAGGAPLPTPVVNNKEAIVSA